MRLGGVLSAGLRYGKHHEVTATSILGRTTTDEARTYEGFNRDVGGNIRVGLEDNLFLDKGVLATNAQLVERAVTVVENMGAKIIGPDAVREKLGLTKRAPVAK